MYIHVRVTVPELNSTQFWKTFNVFRTSQLAYNTVDLSAIENEIIDRLLELGRDQLRTSALQENGDLDPMDALPVELKNEFVRKAQQVVTDRKAAEAQLGVGRKTKRVRDEMVLGGEIASEAEKERAKQESKRRRAEAVKARPPVPTEGPSVETQMGSYLATLSARAATESITALTVLHDAHNGEVWAIIHNEHYLVDGTSLADLEALLEELGVYSAADLEFLEALDIGRVCLLLKAVGAKRVHSMLGV
jgi:hypothetical protein